MSRSSCIGVLFLCLVSIGCSKMVIMPLEPGRTFVTQKEYFDILSGKQDSTVIDTTQITGNEQLNGETYGLLTDRGRSTYLVNRSDGLWVMQDNNILRHYVLYPASENDEYGADTIWVDEAHSRINRWRVEATHVPIGVKAGIFDCNKYVGETLNIGHEPDAKAVVTSRTEMFWAPNTGMIEFKILIHTDVGYKVAYREQLVNTFISRTMRQ